MAEGHGNLTAELIKRVNSHELQLIGQENAIHSLNEAIGYLVTAVKMSKGIDSERDRFLLQATVHMSEAAEALSDDEPEKVA